MRYRIEFGRSITNRQKAQKFRQRVFRELENGLDEDKYDDLSDHCLIFDKENDDKLVLVFRSRGFANMKEILLSYSAEYYDLTQLADLPFKPLEIGRLCADPDANDPFLLLRAFRYLSSLISSGGINFIFGCTSFVGADNPKHLESLGFLGKNQLADPKLLIKTKSSLAIDIKNKVADVNQGNTTKNFLPPLLRFYLRLGGRVSDHAVIDRDLDTLHVFTYVNLKNI